MSHVQLGKWVAGLEVAHTKKSIRMPGTNHPDLNSFKNRRLPSSISWGFPDFGW